MIGLILVVFAVVAYIGVKIYQHDNSKFVKETGYSLKETVANNKINMFKKLSDAAINSPHKLIYNVNVQDVNETYVADAILIDSSGIHIIQFEEKSGWITGTEKSYEWVEQRYRDKKLTFPNPIHNSLRLIYTLTHTHEDFKKDLFDTVIIFSNNCSFQHIEMESSYAEVIKVNEIGQWMTSQKANKLSEDQIEMLYQLLKQHTN